MNILVTGGAGFIGSHLVDALTQKGHAVTVLDNLSSGSQKHISDEAMFVEGDITDHDFVKQLLTENSFDAIFHLAAQISVAHSVLHPLEDAEINILASLNLIQSAVDTGVQTFIFSSTGGAIYGDTELRPTSETHKEAPLSPYGIAKLTIDKYLSFYGSLSPLRTVSLRYSNVYGPRQNPHGEAGVVAIFLEKMLSNINPSINGDGTQTRDYVFVEDVVRANLLALEYPVSGIYNIGTSVETSVNTLFNTLNSFFDTAFTEEHQPTKPGEQMTSALDAHKAQRDLHWTPQTPLPQGLQVTYEWFQQHHSKK